MTKTKNLIRSGVIFLVLIVMVLLTLTSCQTSGERGELSIDNLLERMNDSISAQDFFIKKTVSSYDGSKLNKDFVNIQSSLSNDDRIYFWHETTKFRTESDIQLSSFNAIELWWSEMYETIADSKAGNGNKSKISVWRDIQSSETLVNGKKKSGEETSIADYKIASREQLLNDKLSGYNIDALLNPFVELLAHAEHYSIVDMTRKGLLDFYTIKINESYNAVEGERDEIYDIISDYYLSELGELKITVINTETYGRISSIDNLDDKSSPLIFEMYFSYAAPPINAKDCAEEYVKSINNPGEEEKDMTMIYIIIGLACGLGIPLISVLVWFIVKKFRFFKDYDPEEMEIDDYIKLKKGIAIENDDAKSANNIRDSIDDAESVNNSCGELNTDSSIEAAGNSTIDNNSTLDSISETKTNKTLENNQVPADNSATDIDILADLEVGDSENDNDKEEL